MKIHRLFAILVELLNNSKATAPDLAKRFETSVRTIYRDMETLNQAGIPVVSHQGTGGGFQLMEGFKLDGQLFRKKEIESMIIALEGLSSALSDKQVQEARDKVASFSTKHSSDNEIPPVRIDFTPWGNSKHFLNNLKLLKDSINSNRLIRFSYSNLHGENTGREIEPMQLNFRGLNWYLIGYCRLRQDFRYFKVSRIHELEVLKERFTPRPMNGEGEGLPWNNNLVDLKIAFNPAVKGKAVELFGENHLTEDSSGQILATAKFPLDEWVFTMIMGLGPEAEVLEPKEVREEIQKRCREMFKIYN